MYSKSVGSEYLGDIMVLAICYRLLADCRSTSVVRSFKLLTLPSYITISQHYTIYKL